MLDSAVKSRATSKPVLDAVIVICTHNRADLLGETLASIAALSVSPSINWRVFVVANACTDATPAVLDAWTQRLPLRWVHENTPGLSHARNRAVRELASEPPELVLWTDDDVLVPTQWLEAYVEAARAFPAHDVFGGPIVPEFAGITPTWIARGLPFFGEAFAEIDYGPFDTEVAPLGRLPFGANMAMRFAPLFSRKFDTRLGVTPTSRRCSEELVMLSSILGPTRGWRYVIATSVRHQISAARQTKSHLAALYRGRGEIEELLAPSAGNVVTIFGAPRWMLRAIAESYVARLWFGWIRPDAVRYARMFASTHHRRGVITSFRIRHASQRHRLSSPAKDVQLQ